MNYELEIAFDFKNSKEYFVRYEPIELTDSEKIPEKLKNKKLYVFEKVKPKAKNIGTFLLEFLNLDFSNALHLNYFLVHYFLVNFIASKKNYLNFEYYKNIDVAPHSLAALLHLYITNNITKNNIEFAFLISNYVMLKKNRWFLMTYEYCHKDYKEAIKSNDLSEELLCMTNNLLADMKDVKVLGDEFTK